MKKYSVFHTVYEESPRVTGDVQEYVVKKGDTLYKISQMHGVKLEDLIAANNLTSSLIYPNQIIVIPKSLENGAIVFEEYIIKANDTMSTIANRFGVNVTQLTRYNDISKLILLENQKIRIPRAMKTYVVKESDTIETILQTTKMTLEELMRANTALWLAPGMTINVK